MIVCIDTNAVLQALARNHPYHPILDAWVNGTVTWAVSTDLVGISGSFNSLQRSGPVATARAIN
jgi:hypothetical protein